MGIETEGERRILSRSGRREERGWLG